MLKLKLVADIGIAILLLVLCSLGIVLSNLALVIISTVVAIIFIGMAGADLNKLDAELPRFVIAISQTEFYDGKGGFTQIANAKVYRSLKSTFKAINKLGSDKAKLMIVEVGEL